jgi:hypothetical protein
MGSFTIALPLLQKNLVVLTDNHAQNMEIALCLLGREQWWASTCFATELHTGTSRPVWVKNYLQDLFCHQSWQTLPCCSDLAICPQCHHDTVAVSVKYEGLKSSSPGPQIIKKVFSREVVTVASSMKFLEIVPHRPWYVFCVDKKFHLSAAPKNVSICHFTLSPQFPILNEKSITILNAPTQHQHLHHCYCDMWMSLPQT